MKLDQTRQSDTPNQLSGDLPSRVVDSLTASVAVVDRRGTIVATNEAWRKFGLENGGNPDKTGCGTNYLAICRAACGDDVSFAERAWQGIMDVLEHDRSFFTLEYPCHSPTDKRWFLLQVSPLKDDPNHAVTTHVSITERKLLENQLVESARLAAIGHAMQGLSHKGRNSLQHAQGFIDLLRSQIEHDLEAVKLLDRVENAQRRLISLYEEVQHYAAPIHLHRSPHRLDAIVDESWHSLAPLSNELQFSQLKSSIDLTCEVDPGALGQALRSIFENAMATDPKASLIEVGYSQDELDGLPAITMTISDNGPGIPPEDREKVFEAFYTTQTAGTGLGLATCQRIAKAHGGRIRFAESALGGATIALTLPVVARN